ncbi:hypothetical protein [Arsenicicoccus dermatophilus]|uniref:hypothetical protein n=1 Tax=Arsenicicoccus dermatophilus TaxID=1076331 RepID=UPI003917111A
MSADGLRVAVLALRDRPRPASLQRTAPCPRRRGLAGIPAAGAYAGVTPWRRREVWLDAVEAMARDLGDVLRSPSAAGGRGEAIDVTTLMRVLRAMATTGDLRTGRDIDGHHGTIAARCGCSEGTVARALRIAARGLGVLVEIAEGRRLRLAERRWCWARGIRQQGLPSIWAAHCPPELTPYLEQAAALGAVRARLTGRKTPGHAHLVDCGGHLGESSTGIENSPLTLTHLDAPRAARQPKTTRGQANPRRAAGVTSPGRALGAALAREIASRVPWGHRLRPRAVAAHLAPYAAAGWTAAAWLAAVEQGYRDRGWTPPAQATSPGGLVHHWCQTLDPAALDVGTGELHRPQPCGRPGCDHGWLTTTDVMGRVVAAPCPVCPPIVRTSAWQAETDRLAEETADVQDPAAADEVCPTGDDGDAVLEVQDAEDGDVGLLERVEAAWTAVLTQHAPLATWEHSDPAVWRALLSETIASRRALYTAAGWGPEQVAAVDPAAAHRTHTLTRLATRTKRARRG